jgi:hypothetical protein
MIPFWLEVLGNGSAVLTAIVAVLAYGQYQWRKYRQRQELEKYLRSQLAEPKNARAHITGRLDSGARTITHLVAHLGMTEADILEAAFVSKRIARLTGVDAETGRAADLLLRYAVPVA